MAIAGSSGGLSSATQGIGAGSQAVGGINSGLTNAFGPLTGWQGSGAVSAANFVQIAQANFAKAQASLDAVHAAMNRYSLEVEQAQIAWNNADLEETQFKDQLTKAKVDLVADQEKLIGLEKQLAAAEAANAVASASAAILSGVGLAASPAAAPIPTAPIQAEINAVQQQLTALQQQITTLQNDVTTKEAQKRADEERAKAASAKVTQEVHAAQQMWPNVYTAAPSWLNVCIAGYTPPPPPQQGGGGGFFGILAAGGIGLATIAGNLIPGVGEAQDAAAPEEIAAVLGDTAATTTDAAATGDAAATTNATTLARAATDQPRVTDWLRSNDYFNRSSFSEAPHTITHVGLTDQQLADRLAQEGMTQTSTFTNVTTAENAVSDTLSANQSEILAWEKTAAAGEKQAFTLKLSEPAGRVLNVGSSAAKAAKKVVVVLRADPTSSDGFHILTSYLKR